MIKNTITQIILKADEGFYLTDGETYAKTVILPESADASVWCEVTEEEYNAFVEKVKAEERVS